MAKLLRLYLAILTFLVFFLLDDPANEISTRWIGCQWRSDPEMRVPFPTLRNIV